MKDKGKKRIRHKEPNWQGSDLDYNCTTSVFADQIGVELWKVMACGVYFKRKEEKDD